MKLPINQIIQGNILDVLLTFPSGSIDMIITSPPYWSLRDYGLADQVWDCEQLCNHRWDSDSFCLHCGGWRGQLGLEPSFDLYVRHLGVIFDQLYRVLKPEGTCWVNLGDTYSGSNNGSHDHRTVDGLGQNPRGKYRGQRAGKTRLPAKCLVQIPSRFALAMCDRGWILRNEIIWHKPNCLPSSVKDRFTVDFEKLFLFVKSKTYYFEADAVRVPHGPDKRLAGIRRAREYGYGGKGSYQDWYFNQRKKTDWVAGRKTLAMGMYASRGQTDNKPPLIHPLGRSRRCVWTIPTKAFAGAHFAVYPPALVEIPIKAGCPEGGIVLDPFFGSGTTGMVALELKRCFIGVELNPEYIRLAQERIRPYLSERRLAC